MGPSIHLIIWPTLSCFTWLYCNWPQLPIYLVIIPKTIFQAQLKAFILIHCIFCHLNNDRCGCVLWIASNRSDVKDLVTCICLEIWRDEERFRQELFFQILGPKLGESDIIYHTWSSPPTPSLCLTWWRLGCIVQILGTLHRRNMFFKGTLFVFGPFFGQRDAADQSWRRQLLPPILWRILHNYLQFVRPSY